MRFLIKFCLIWGPLYVSGAAQGAAWPTDHSRWRSRPGWRRSDWLWLAIGLFAYHGLAEELAWRGYPFRRLRRGRSFGAAIGRTIP